MTNAWPHKWPTHVATSVVDEHDGHDCYKNRHHK